ncbi:hypothetical protein CU665_19695 [Pseudomonas syringae pv. actinidifoliorum]|nr:hypothetical protein [Pseudomonas syringae pv. actinidifoliorum]
MARTVAEIGSPETQSSRTMQIAAPVVPALRAEAGLCMTIVPMLRVGMQFWTLCVLFVFVKLCVTQRFCYVSWICLRLKAPFRPSATDFEGSK